MRTPNLVSTLAPAEQYVKPQPSLPGFEHPPDSVIHHKSLYHSKDRIVYKYTGGAGPYGVSSSRRPISPGLFNKREDQVGRFLQEVVLLSRGESTAIIRLARLYVYYGKCFPRAAQVANDFQPSPAQQYLPFPGYIPPRVHRRGCSRATFWRAVRQLRELGLITVINRFLIRPHAQISNEYRLDKLLLVIARYLAEHGVPFYEKWLKPYLQLPGSTFWPSFWRQLTPGASSISNGPG